MSKYIGTEKGLAGPVEINKPTPPPDISTYGKHSGLYFSDKYHHDCNMEIYREHLSTLPVIPCEGWQAEPGREYEEGVQFVWQYQYTNGIGGWLNCDLDTYIKEWKNVRRIVAVPAPEVATDKKSPWPLLGHAPGNYSNHCANCGVEMNGVDKLCFQCLECAVKAANEIMGTPPIAPAIPEAEGDEFLKYVKESRKDFCTAVHRLPEFNVPLRTAIDSMLICFDQMADRLQSPAPVQGGGYPQEFVEGLIAAMTDDERMNFFSNYCKYCGTPDTYCQCWNDE